jgi:hypothetical protein
MMVRDFWDAICYVFVVFTWNMDATRMWDGALLRRLEDFF